MKVKQSIVLGYYLSKLRLLSILSPRLAAKEAFQLFCTPFSARKSLPAPAVFDHVKKMVLSHNGHRIQVYNWQPSTPTGRRILICHGFDSSIYKFSHYIQAFLDAGCIVWALDAPAHGASSGATVNAAIYADVIQGLIENHGPFEGIMTHSLGGLAAVLALERMPAATVDRLVLVAPATESTTAANSFFQKIPLSLRVQNEFYKLVTETAGKPMEWYSVSRAISNLNVTTLWIHDRDDQLTPLDDVTPVMKQQPANVTFHITSGLGHSNIYRDAQVQAKIVDFLTNPA